MNNIVPDSLDKKLKEEMNPRKFIDIMTEVDKNSLFSVCDEMKKLRDGLNERKIPWHDASDKGMIGDKPSNIWICRTHLSIKGIKYSVINGYGTYGGIAFIGQRNKGLLEAWSSAINNGEVTGYLTAEEILKIIDNV